MQYSKKTSRLTLPGELSFVIARMSFLCI